MAQALLYRIEEARKGIRRFAMYNLVRPFRARRSSGVSTVEYGIMISLLSATLWAVFATWKIWGWGDSDDLERHLGEGQAELTQLIDDTAEPEAIPDPTWTNDNGTFTVANPTATTRVSVRYMGANAGLASVSSLWMRIRHSDGSVEDIQMTTNNTGAARDLVSDKVLADGDDISFMLRVKPKPWSTSYYNFQNSRGRLTGTGTSAYYDVPTSNSTPPDNVTTVTNYAAGSPGNYFGVDEYHIGYEDLALDYSGCDRDYNDAEFRVALTTTEE